MDAVLFSLTAIAYLIAAATFFFSLFRGETAARLPSAILLAGFGLHSSALILRFMEDGFAAVAVMGHALLFYGWLMVGIYLLIQLRYRRAPLPARRAGQDGLVEYRFFIEKGVLS